MSTQVKQESNGCLEAIWCLVLLIGTIYFLYWLYTKPVTCEQVMNKKIIDLTTNDKDLIKSCKD